MPKLLYCILSGLILFFPINSLNAQTWQPGFRTIGLWQDEPFTRLDLNIWYPALRQAQELHIGPWKIRGAHNAKPSEGSFPLLIVSHATPATRFSYADLCRLLACQGYIVVALTHGKDNLDNMEDLYSWGQLERRTSEIRQTLDKLLEDHDLSPHIDVARIGLLGFGSGASAALLLGGALPDCTDFRNLHNKTSISDTYPATAKISLICQNFPLRKSLADPRIKAIAAIAPGFGFIFNAGSFKYFYPPLLLATTGKDILNNPATNSEYLGRLLGQRAFYLDLPLADTGALLDECPQNLAAELPELCKSVTESERQALRKVLASSLLTFFNRFLIKELPQIPAPPELSPPPIQEKTAQSDSPKERKKRNRK